MLARELRQISDQLNANEFIRTSLSRCRCRTLVSPKFLILPCSSSSSDSLRDFLNGFSVGRVRRSSFGFRFSSISCSSGKKEGEKSEGFSEIRQIRRIRFLVERVISHCEIIVNFEQSTLARGGNDARSASDTTLSGISKITTHTRPRRHD